ncbi:unnamed protein product [Clavelina lepadiformis]|uniref:Uncharacterized protein n=1 Tax=Clavelina lepadiformis TaxID=159417 RepID=A0ABP0FN71_CLALP
MNQRIIEPKNCSIQMSVWVILSLIVIDATLTPHDFPSFQLTSNTVSATTGYGLPGPITTAFVNNQTGPTSSECVVEWIHDGSDFNTSFPTEQRLMVVVPLDLHGHNLTVNMTIQAYSCAGAGPPSIVSGFCVSPLLPPPQTNPPPQSCIQIQTFFLLGIMIGVLAFVVLVLIIAYFLRKRTHANILTKLDRPSITTTYKDSPECLLFNGNV